MKSSRQRPRPPAGAVIAALDECRKLLTNHPDVLSMGIGLKHARAVHANHGYGAKPRACIKIVIRQKRTRVAKATSLPTRVAVIYRRRRYFIPIDVESSGGCHPHGPVPRLYAGNNERQFLGTPGIFVRDRQGAVLLLTAGHLVKDPRTSIPRGTVKCVTSDGERSLDIKVDASYFDIRYAGISSLADVALLETGFRTPDDVPRDFRALPWSVRVTVPDAQTIKRRLAEGRSIQVRYAGALNQGAAIIDGILDDAFIDHPKLLADQRIYAPAIVHYRTIPLTADAPNTRFVEGDSGAALITASGLWIGLHVIGWNTPSRQNEGWAQVGHSLLEYLRSKVGELTPIGTVPMN
jgi:hypothetical protein